MEGNNRFLFSGKELQDEFATPGKDGHYDFGTRFFDLETGRWNTVDPSAELLEMSSPYVYALNRPVNFIDKDGEREDDSYLDAQLLRTIASSGIPNPGRQIHFVDGNQGRHAINGKHYVTHDRAVGARDRFLGGQMEARKDFGRIMSMLERDPKSKKITEKIQIYTHSRGGAFGAGYTDARLELIRKNSKQFANPNNVIDFVLNLPPHQSNFFDAPKGSNLFSINHDWNFASGGDMDNNIGFQTNTKSWHPLESHQNGSFATEVQAFLESYQRSNGNNGI